MAANAADADAQEGFAAFLEKRPGATLESLTIRRSWIADRPHTRSGVSGMSRWRTPRWASASTTAFCTAGGAPMVPDSAMPLTPRGLLGDGVTVLRHSNDGRSARRREGVVDEAARAQVAVLVVDELLEQRLRDALAQPAVHLALGEQRVEDHPGVVDRRPGAGSAPRRCRGRPPPRTRTRRTGTSRPPR